MPCPTCRGVIRTEIAPSYWRCDSTITIDREGPGFQNPGMGPPVLYETRVCGNTYLEASSTPTNLGLCACNTGAIGFCSDCQRPVCGIHSALWDGKPFCDEHYEVKAAAKRTAEARERWERQRAYAAELEAKRREEERQAAELLIVETEARADVLDVLEKLRRGGYPGSEKQKLYKGGSNHFIDHYRRRAWLLHTIYWVDDERNRRESMSFWVTNHGEYVDHWRVSVASVDLYKCLNPDRYQLGPFGRDNVPELRWSGILKTLSAHL